MKAVFRRYFLSLMLVAAVAALTVPAASAQSDAESDTIRVDDGRIVIVVEDGAVVLRDGRRRTGEPRVRREVRVERRDNPRGLWMMHRDGSDADTVVVDVDRIARVVERAVDRVPRDFERWFEDLDVAPLGDIMEERGEIMRMEAEARELARRARSAEGAERERLEDELRAHLDDLFSQKLNLERERLDRMQQRVERGQRELEERSARRGEIVERRYRELLGDRDVLEW